MSSPVPPAGTVAPAVAVAPHPIVPQTPPPPVSAESAILVDAITGRILAAKDPDARRAVASTQKLLTALLVVEAGSLDKTVVIAESDTKVEPSKLYLRAGETYPRRTLLKAILVKSANDAAKALARDVAGSEEAFVARMNHRARGLGMTSSNFTNPHGLTEEGQFSTARDIALVARAAYRRPEIRRHLRIREYEFVHSDGRTRKLENTNDLLDQLPYATGMKTGTTRASGKCLVSSAELNGRVAIGVILGSTKRAIWDDSESLLRWALEFSTAPLVAVE